MFVTCSVSVCCKGACEAVLNWTSKGRLYDLKRASFASQKGVFSSPIKHQYKSTKEKILT